MVGRNDWRLYDGSDLAGGRGTRSFVVVFTKCVSGFWQSILLGGSLMSHVDTTPAINLAGAGALGAERTEHIVADFSVLSGALSEGSISDRRRGRRKIGDRSIRWLCGWYRRSIMLGDTVGLTSEGSAGRGVGGRRGITE